jgi:hypothetical protein
MTTEKMDEERKEEWSERREETDRTPHSVKR